MAEGGFDEFEIPTFYGDDYDDDGIDRDEAETSFTDEAQFQRTPKNQSDAMKDLIGVERENQLKEVGKSLIQTFYDRNQEAFTRVKGVSVGKSNSGRLMLYVADSDRKIPLTYYTTKSPDASRQFYSFNLNLEAFAV